MIPTSGTVPTSGTPIYDRLVRERGDVPAEARKTAETALQEAARALDFRRPAHRPTGIPGHRDL